MTEANEITYAAAGVDTAEGARAVEGIRESVQSTYRPEVVGDIGGFGGLFSAAAFKDMVDPVMVSGTDGVGTKLVLAQQMDVHDTVGIDLVAMCVNDILVVGAEPLFFLDYVAVGKLESARMAAIVAGVAEGCRQAGCSLIGGEMAEHPGVMKPDDYDLSGFCTGVVDRPKMIDGAGVTEGDVILGLPSTGVHSNGFSLVRRAIAGLPLDEPRDDLSGQTLGATLLEPTRIYVKTVRALLDEGLPIKAMAHITGGGISENLNRALPAGVDALVQKGSWDVPEIFGVLCELTHLSEAEALKTFNMGIGFALIVAASDAEAVRAALLTHGEPVYTIGEIVAGSGTVKYK
jgi:phosphoribosylformylglycinamidine cyclo-ligase